MDRERNNTLSTVDNTRLNSGNGDKSSVPPSSSGENKK
jgi:hypothetical protein